MNSIVIRKIYQGRVLDDAGGEVRGKLAETHRWFPDAVNYFVVALAGMGDEGDESVGGRWRRRVRSIWDEHPMGEPAAETLRESLTRTLSLPADCSFDEAVDRLFDGCERRDVLHHVLQFIIDTASRGVIHLKERSLLPKLCSPGFHGNFDFSARSTASARGQKELRGLLNSEPSEEALRDMAGKMDLSWANIKTKENKYFTLEETRDEVRKALNEIVAAVEQRTEWRWNKALGDDCGAALDELRGMLARLPGKEITKPLARCYGTHMSRKRAAIAFMYFPCPLSARLLQANLGTTWTEDAGKRAYSELEDDPLILARGKRRYVFPGFTALPLWAQAEEGGAMREWEWDSLALREALKALRAFDLETREREQRRAEALARIARMEGGEGALRDSETDEILPVLGGDPRYALVQDLLEELRRDGLDAEDAVSRRALRPSRNLVPSWKQSLAEGKTSDEDLLAAVRRIQGSADFGSLPLFSRLVQEKYRPIWRDHAPEDRLPRSQDVLRDVCRLQELREEAERLAEDLRLTAAEAVYSPRPLVYTLLAPKWMRHLDADGPQGVVELGVAAKGEDGLRRRELIRVRFSAPRFDREILGSDSMTADGGDTAASPWLRPMMRALGLDRSTRLSRDSKKKKAKPSAMSLTVAYERDGHSAQPLACLLDFPVKIDVHALQAALGKASRWDRMFIGARDEKIHLHWPATYTDHSEAWWYKGDIVRSGFTCLGVDLGAHGAAAWSLVQAQARDAFATTPDAQAGRLIGYAGKRSWHARPAEQGHLRIDGEGDTIAPRPETAPAADAARRPTEEETAWLADWCRRLKHPAPASCRDILALHRHALRAFSRLLSRLRTHLSWLAKPGDEDGSTKRLEKMKDRLEHDQPDAPLLPLVEEALESRDSSRIPGALRDAIEETRRTLPALAEELAQRLLPLGKGRWAWLPGAKAGMAGMAGSGVLEWADRESPRPDRNEPIFPRGGLSVEQLEQLEDLHRSLQCMSLLLAVEAGEPAPFERETRQSRDIDPCPALLREITRIREQRVHAIALGIVALALGVRLKPTRPGQPEGDGDALHREYERIPGREPVDFVAMGTPSRSRATADRPCGGNTRITRRTQRRIVAKATQLLEEIFGIPVLFPHARYSSPFDSSEPGFRAGRLVIREGNADFENPKRLAAYRQALARLSAEATPADFFLCMPQTDGEFFLSRQADGEMTLRQADIDAASRIVWRGLVAPEASLQRPPRKKGGKARRVGERILTERKKQAVGQDPGKTFETPSPAAGAHPPDSLPPEREGADGAFAHGKDRRGAAKAARWSVCDAFNAKQLRRRGFEEEAALLESLAEPEGAGKGEDIPL